MVNYCFGKRSDINYNLVNKALKVNYIRLS